MTATERDRINELEHELTRARVDLVTEKLDKSELRQSLATMTESRNAYRSQTRAFDKDLAETTEKLKAVTEERDALTRSMQAFVDQLNTICDIKP